MLNKLHIVFVILIVQGFWLATGCTKINAADTLANANMSVSPGSLDPAGNYMYTNIPSPKISFTFTTSEELNDCVIYVDALNVNINSSISQTGDTYTCSADLSSHGLTLPEGMDYVHLYANGVENRYVDSDSLMIDTIKPISQLSFDYAVDNKDSTKLNFIVTIVEESNAISTAKIYYYKDGMTPTALSASCTYAYRNPTCTVNIPNDPGTYHFYSIVTDVHSLTESKSAVSEYSYTIPSTADSDPDTSQSGSPETVTTSPEADDVASEGTTEEEPADDTQTDDPGEQETIDETEPDKDNLSGPEVTESEESLLSKPLLGFSIIFVVLLAIAFAVVILKKRGKLERFFPNKVTDDTSEERKD